MVMKIQRVIYTSNLCPSTNLGTTEDEDFQPKKDSVTNLIESWKKDIEKAYIPLIHKAHKTCHWRVPKEGEIVIVKEDNVPRSSMKLG